ncbi:FAD-dependent oxidoreductase [Flagellimonas sp. HMM57]|uniref:FAD-dependent oxidoreductase n=1 Tax=Flagellimonas sp. HMM57 TaxID=2905121 RepID=UPI001F47B33E|nr:FAD-dependent oxidoreductase [Flagellimonas sp. HMM57]UII75352.1 FAD-dependent oxidoreductase [Flagellimonas sp. HMM57]
MKVVLVQDRPVLGGNSSSEVRLWALGATSHMGNNNRWSREGGFINEVLLDNLYRNKEGNPLVFDTILLEKVYEESNIQLLLNTAVYDVTKSDDKNIGQVKAFCSQNSTTYILKAPLFCDASGDGIVAFKAGASFRMGAETAEEFDEQFAPNIEDYGNLLGHSLYFYSKDVGKPVEYVPPSFAIDNAGELPRIKNYQLNEHGCKLWWVEYGGRLDTVHQSEEIKFELWKVVYGIWDYVKNSGKYPEAENLTLEWVGTIPGKRESRRFEGDFVLTQKDIIEQRDYYDSVAFGGWAMDLHPADGVYSEHNSCTQWHSKGVYSIPYRCYYSKDIENLFFAGRIISASHVAFGSSRVMLTCAHGAQAVGKAAAICIKNNWLPRVLSEEEKIGMLQMELNRDGQSIPRLETEDSQDLAQSASLVASSELSLSTMNSSKEWQALTVSTAQLLPLKSNTKYSFTGKLRAKENTTVTITLKHSSSKKHYTPDVELESKSFQLHESEQEITFTSEKELDSDGYVYLCFMKNEVVEIALSDERFSGVMTVQHKVNPAVSNYGIQEPPEGIGVDTFEFWTPQRFPKGKNLALDITPPIQGFFTENLKNQQLRPTSCGNTNVWLSDIDDKNPKLSLQWDKKQTIGRIKLFFDSDYDNALESILMTHPKSVTTFMQSDYEIHDAEGNVIFSKNNNYQAINTIELDNPIQTDAISVVFKKSEKHIPVALFKVAVYPS